LKDARFLKYSNSVLVIIAQNAKKVKLIQNPASGGEA
jgi:hypothetical protein